MNKGKKRREGGQPGNLNRAKNALPAIARVLNGRPLPAHLNRVVQLARSEAEDLIQDKGGPDEITAAERMLVANWSTARSCELLILDELFQRGSAICEDSQSGTWDLAPAMQRLDRFLSVQCRILAALGLQRKAKGVRSLEKYMQKKYGVTMPG